MMFRLDSLIVYLAILCLVLNDIAKQQWFGATLGVFIGMILIYMLAYPNNKHMIDLLLWRRKNG